MSGLRLFTLSEDERHVVNELEMSAGENVALVTLNSSGDAAWINLTAAQLHGLAYYATLLANELDEKQEAK